MNKAKGLVAVCGIVVAVSLSGCAAGATANQSAGGSGAAGTTTPPAVQVDQDLQTVSVTIKRSLLDAEGKKTDAELVQGAREKGITATVNGDTLVYTMTIQQQEEMLKQMRISLRDSNAQLVAEKKSSITAVETNDALTEYTVKVDGDRYTVVDAFYALAFYVQGGLYQQFAGIAADQIDVRVQFVDKESGKVLNTGSYREWVAKQTG